MDGHEPVKENSHEQDFADRRDTFNTYQRRNGGKCRAQARDSIPAGAPPTAMVRVRCANRRGRSQLIRRKGRSAVRRRHRRNQRQPDQQSLRRRSLRSARRRAPDHDRRQTRRNPCPAPGHAATRDARLLLHELPVLPWPKILRVLRAAAAVHSSPANSGYPAAVAAATDTELSSPSC
jgi:hypothetical protein